MAVNSLSSLLKNLTFVDIATCDFQGRPNAAPKFLLKHEKDSIYLVDYTKGRSYYNLERNPKISIPVMDFDTLIGYQINGQAAILEDGLEHRSLAKELKEKVKRLSVERLIEGVKSDKIHANFEVVFPKKVVIFKIKVKEIVEIGPAGEIKREQV